MDDKTKDALKRAKEEEKKHIETFDEFEKEEEEFEKEKKELDDMLQRKK